MVRYNEIGICSLGYDIQIQRSDVALMMCFRDGTAHASISAPGRNDWAASPSRTDAQHATRDNQLGTGNQVQVLRIGKVGNRERH